MSTLLSHPASRLYNCQRRRNADSATNNPNAFLLSLRGFPDEFCDLHSFGYHKVPHVGVYGDNYSLAMPLVVLSLPALPCCLMQLPVGLLDSLHIPLSVENVARELVQIALLSALHKLGYSSTTQPQRPVSNWYSNLPQLGKMHRGVLQSTCTEASGGSPERNIEEEEEEKDEVEDEDEEEEEVQEEDEATDEEHIIYIQARKLVRKAIHLACKRWELMNRRCSIDYLISNTKKMKISESPSPSSSPDSEERQTEEYDDGIGIKTSSYPPVIDDDEEEEEEEERRRKLGKKRPRSESHDAVMMRELNMFQMQRHSKSVGNLGNTIHGLPIIAPSRRHQKNVNSHLNDLVTSIQRMAIAEVKEEYEREEEEAEEEEEEEKEEEEEEEYTVLEAITQPCHDPAGGGTFLATQSQLSSSCSENTTVDTGNKLTPLPNLDYFITVHSHTPPGLCQKFLCSNTNEVNLVYHCWVYPNVPIDPSLSVVEQVEMGVFLPSAGVLPVHQDLQDAGIAFNHLEPRSVSIHNCCFSPENAQLQLMLPPLPPPLLLPALEGEGPLQQQLFTFFSAAKHGERKVITFHVLPTSKEVEMKLRQAVGLSGNTLTGLLTSLHTNFPELADRLEYLLSPLSYHPRYF